MSKLMDIFSRSQTYRDDLELFVRLGLPVFDVTDQEWHDLGTVQQGVSAVKVSVLCAPAQFWKFEISNAGDGSKYDIVLETGSGMLVDYWPTVEQICGGMLVISSWVQTMKYDFKTGKRTPVVPAPAK